MSSSQPPPIIASFTKPVPEASPYGWIWIYHPLRNLIFLSIPVRKCPLPGGNQSGQPCMPSTAVLDACQVVTGKKGKLAGDQHGQEVVQADLVMAGGYYYVVDEDWEVDYGIFYTFDAWIPPQREEVPDHWFTGVYPRSGPPPQTTNRWDGVSGRSVNTLREKASGLDGACKLSRTQPKLLISYQKPTGIGTTYAGSAHNSATLCQSRGTSQMLTQSTTYAITSLCDQISTTGGTPTPSSSSPLMGISSRTTSHAPSKGRLPTSTVLDTPERTDGYLLYLRFALAIFERVGNHKSFEPHPNSSPLVTPHSLPFKASPTVSRATSLQATPEGNEMSAGTGLPRAQAVLSDAVGYDLNEGMDSVTAAKHIIDWYSDVEREDLPADLAWAWRDLIDDKDDDNENTERLKREWLERQRRQLREDRPDWDSHEVVQDNVVGSQDSG
ncbi:hypothetical protein L226DRAFT_616903 [Lentinus tigrinus ALCF2SS1-7]|uniref:Uncharacterized protein n=1 Tax=Lentinus tigrinus ALCF2SS1-6 TaxID=1328759 RepID=A0A5C2RSC2_9APHY|nr:hypothetical protein L227DRAFT_604050 [Lentinus tigrinus ALCF2SS1-6]RPD69372.1 hypothetical protein L226DRAFT_616903 [Lentinus tigrinus ALCF2SS1-7]